MKNVEMKCDRCGGRMSFEHFMGRGGKEGIWSYEAWRCLFCGEVLDSQILINRRSLSRLGKEAGVGEKVAA
jgi:uncharacterized Zn finger protein